MTWINMSIKVRQIFLSVSILCAVNFKAWSQESDLPPDVSKKVAAATVRIICNDGVSTGSGSVIGITGKGLALILTTAHVVSSNFAEADANTPLEFYDKIEVELPNTSTAVAAELLTKFIDRGNHLALVATRSSVPIERVMSYARAGKVKPGQQVMIFGFSETNRLSLTTGRIVSVRDRVLVLDTPMASGSSGGPIVNEDGRMVGLATSLKTGEEDTRGYAIRIAVVSAVVNDWLTRLTGLKLTWQSEGKKFPTAWVIGGVLAAGGGTAAALLISGDGEKGFPEPPFRPEGN